MGDILTTVPIRRTAVLAASLIFAALSGLIPQDASADEARLKFLSEKLRDNDARVRTSAALALGASNEDGAVDPLCVTLSDKEDVVRQASAVALKRLGRSRSLDCLRARESVEQSDAAKTAITRAIEAIASSDQGDGDVVKDNPNAKYYVSLSSIANETGRPQPEIDRIVLTSIRQKLDEAGFMQLAPSKEAPDKAREAMKARKLKAGFYLAIAVDRFDYSGGNLRVKVKIGVFNYPNKSMIGSFEKEGVIQGVSAGDKDSENRLLDSIAGRACEKFAKNIDAFL